MGAALRGSLKLSLAGALAALWTSLFALTGWATYRSVRAELVAALGGQLANAARLLAGQLGPGLPRTADMEPGQPAPALAKALAQVRGAGVARNLVLLNSQGTVLSDALGEEAPGFHDRGLGPDEWARLGRGETVVHAPEEGAFGEWDQSAYTPLRSGAVLELRADPAYLAALSRLRSQSLWLGALGLGLCVGLGLALAARILQPLGWMQASLRGEAVPDDGRQDELASAARAVHAGLRDLAAQGAEARARREAAEARAEQLRQVASAIAHEVRNPLGVIRGQTDLLARSLGPGPPPEPLQRIRQQVAQLDSVVSRFLDFGRAPRLEPKPLDLADLVRRLAAELSALAGPAWDLRVQAPASLMLRADPALLEGALLNLAQNAVQSMPGGGVVLLVLERDGGQAWVDIRDQGPGLGTQARERLFEPFFTTKAGGSGLGLALARRAAEAHGGTLEALDSSQGAWFRLTLPLEGL
jgi:signal transduction histidine kinase